MRSFIVLFSCLLLAGGCKGPRAPELMPESFERHLGVAGLPIIPSSQSAVAPTPPVTSQGQAPVPSTPCPCHHHHAEAAPPARAPLPGASLYHLDATWTTQDNAPLQLAALRGHPVLVLMFFGTCRGACPILVHDLQRIDEALDPATRAATRVVMITFDPERDTPAALRQLANERHLDTTRYSLLHGTEAQIRSVAAVLGVQYARVANGFDHSNQITLLDRDGVPAFTLEGLARPVDEIVRRTQAIGRVQ